MIDLEAIENDCRYVKGFEIGKILSSGMIGIVYLARRDTYPFNLYTLKVMSFARIKEKRLEASIKREMNYLCQARGYDNCIQLLDLIYTKSYVCLVFPYYHNGDLYNYLLR